MPGLSERYECLYCTWAYDNFEIGKDIVDPHKLNTDTRRYQTCEACGKKKKKVFRVYVCKECWGVFITNKLF